MYLAQSFKTVRKTYENMTTKSYLCGSVSVQKSSLELAQARYAASVAQQWVMAKEPGDDTLRAGSVGLG